MFVVYVCGRYKIVLIGFRVRMIGLAVVNFCMVAFGSGEVYYEYGIYIWDFVVVGIIFIEVGGLFLDLVGSLLMLYLIGSLLLYLINSLFFVFDLFMYVR